jgi:hypothetical protein
MGRWAEEQVCKISDAKESIAKRKKEEQALQETRKNAARPFLDELYTHMVRLAGEFNEAHGKEFLICEGWSLELGAKTTAYPGGHTSLAYDQSRNSIHVTEETIQHALSRHRETRTHEWFFDVVGTQQEILLDRRTPEKIAESILERLIEFLIPSNR